MFIPRCLDLGGLPFGASLSGRVHSDGATPAFNPLTDLSNLFSFWRLDSATTGGGTVTAVLDQVGSLPLSGLAGYSAADSNFNGKPSAQFAGTNLFTESTTGAWNFLHDGTGATFWMVYRAASTGSAQKRLFSTMGGSFSNVGIEAYHDSTYESLVFSIGNGSGNPVTMNNLTMDGVAQNNQPHLLAVRFMTGASPGAMCVTLDGKVVYNDSAYVTPSSSNPNTVFNIGSAGLSLTELVTSKSYLSDSNIGRVLSYAANRYGVTGQVFRDGSYVNMLFDGNSITAASRAWPYLMSLNFPFRGQNRGISGQTTPQMITRFPTHEAPFLVDSTAAENIYVMWELINDYGTGSPSVATVVAHYVTLCNLAKAQGATVLAIPMIDNLVVSELDRAAINAGLAAVSPQPWDMLLTEVLADAHLGASGAASDTAYFSDGVHLTATGEALFATYVAAKLNAWRASH